MTWANREIRIWTVVILQSYTLSACYQISVLLNVNLIKCRTHRLENLEDNFEKKDGLASGLIAFVSCVCVWPWKHDIYVRSVNMCRVFRCPQRLSLSLSFRCSYITSKNTITWVWFRCALFWPEWNVLRLGTFRGNAGVVVVANLLLAHTPKLITNNDFK